MSLLPFLLPFLFTLPLTTVSSTTAQCYYPSSIPQPNDTPCDPSLPVSNCCAPDDICLSNGLCYRANINRLHRGSCTDPTFSSPLCAQICTKTPDDHPFGWADVLLCPLSDDWYCGWGNQSRCERGETFKLQDGYFADKRYVGTAGMGGGDVKTGGGGMCTTGATSTVTVPAHTTAPQELVTASPVMALGVSAGVNASRTATGSPSVLASEPAMGMGGSQRVEIGWIVVAAALGGIGVIACGY
ncbi:MAG: hypothetical protein LQ345_007372 [Seirophora villosa]|nr:MAG: hypothetical protein LQ345_007372 [Seirophora villosa]